MIEIVEYLQHFQRPVEIFKENVNTGLAGLTIRGLLNAYVDTINDLKDSLEKQSATVEHYRKEMELMRRQLEAKDEVNMIQSQASA